MPLTETDSAGAVRLLPVHDVANHAALSPLRVNAWLLATRFSGGDILAALRAGTEQDQHR